MDHRCPDGDPSCAPASLCPGCYGRTLAGGLGQARVLGEVWAERVARDPVHRGRAWPETERTLELAAAKVEPLSADPRVRAKLARACLAGAAAWWARRPARYR